MVDRYINDDGNTDEITLSDLADFSNIIIEKDSIITAEKNGKTKISPTEAASSFITRYNILASTEGSLRAGNMLWIYNTKKGVFTPNGITIVKYIMETVGGDLSTTNVEHQVINRLCTHRPFDPENFDPDPYLLCVKNGVIDLRNGNFMKHSPKYLMTSALDIEYDPKAKCANFMKFLEDIVEDPKDIGTILDFITVMCIRKPYDIFLELIGTGANGKGRLLLFIRWFFGKDKISSLPLKQLGKRFASNDLYGKWGLING